MLTFNIKETNSSTYWPVVAGGHRWWCWYCLGSHRWRASPLPPALEWSGVCTSGQFWWRCHTPCPEHRRGSLMRDRFDLDSFNNQNFQKSDSVVNSLLSPCMNSKSLLTTVLRNFQWALRKRGYWPTIYMMLEAMMALLSFPLFCSHKPSRSWGKTGEKLQRDENSCYYSHP